MINAVIIEDEPALAMNLELLIKEYCPDINLVAFFVSGQMALEKLPFFKLWPDIFWYSTWWYGCLWTIRKTE